MRPPRARGEGLCVGLDAAVRPLQYNHIRLPSLSRTLLVWAGSPSLCKTYVGGEHIAEYSFRNVIQVRGRVQFQQLDMLSYSQYAHFVLPQLSF